MKFLPTSLINRLKDTDMKSFVKMLLLLQSGLYVTLGLFTIMVMMSVVSGDSTIQKRNVIMPQSIQPNKENR